MLDSLSLNPFKFSDAGKKKGSPFGFHMLSKGNNLFDGVTGAPASCSISGARWGIVNGVVSQFAENVPPLEDKGLRCCPAYTQLAKYTEDLTNVAWSKTNILTPTLTGTFQGKNIWALIENTATNVAHSLIDSTAFTGAADNSVMGISLIAKNNGRLLEVIGRIKDGSYPVVCRINLQTGIISNLRAGSVASCVDIGNGFYRIFATLPVGVGAQTPYLYIQLHNGSSNIYTGDGVSGILVGQPTFINLSVSGIPFIPPYVPNNTGSSVSVVSEAATSTTGTSFDLDLPSLSAFKKGTRGPLAQGHIELEVESNVASGWLSINSHTNILSANNANLSVLYVTKDGFGNLFFRCYDGTNLAAVSIPPITVGQTFKISIDYGTYIDGTQKMRLTVNGVKSSVVAFSGSFGTQDLKFFYGALLHAFFIKLGSFKFIPKPIW